MPTLRPLNEREAAYVAKQGQDPEAYAFDEATGEAVIKPEFEYLTKADSPTREFVKGGVRSLRDTAANALDFLGASLRTSAEDPRALVRDLAGLPPKENPKSSAFEGIGRSVRSIAEDSLEADPRSPKAALAGEVTGQMLQFLIPALAGAKALSTASVAESMLSGAEGVRNDYAAAQEKAGTPVSEEEALARGASYIPVSMAEQAILSKVAPFIAPFSGRGAGERLAKTALKPMRFALDEAVRGGGGEAVDSVTSQLMGTGEVDPTQVAVEALAGGLTQGGAAGVAARNKSAGDKAAEAKKKFAEKKAKAEAPAEADARVPEFAKQMVTEGLLDPNVPDEVERVASAPSLEKAQQVFEQTVAVKAMLASQARNMKHDPINPTPVDKVFEQMRSKGLPTTPDMLHKLWDVYDGKPENAEKVEKAARFMADSLAPQQPAKREFVAAAVTKQVAEIGKIDSAIESVARRIESIDKQLKEITSAPPSGDAGDLVLRFNQTQRAQRKVLMGQMDELLRQKELLVQQGVSPEPAVEPVPRQRQLGQGDPGRPLGPAIPAGAPRQPALIPRVSSASAQPEGPVTRPAIPMGPPTVEGEQGLPFSGANKIRPGTLGEAQPVPENAAQIAAQYALTLDPASTKKATLVTPGSPVGEIPAGLESFESPHGLFVFNPAKMTRAEADAAVAGKVVDGRVFGYGNPPSTEGGTHAVTTDVGPVKGALSEIVRSPEEAAAAAQAQALAAPGSQQNVIPAEQALAERTATLDRNMVLFPNPEKLIEGTYMTHGAVELVKPRPFGLTPDKNGNVPVPALLAKMKQVIPKGERAFYEEKGLAKFLEGRNSVPVKDLDNWIQENSPKLEVLILKPHENDRFDLPVKLDDQAARLNRLSHELESLGVYDKYSKADDWVSFFVELDRFEFNTQTGELAQIDNGMPYKPIVPVDQRILTKLMAWHAENIKYSDLLEELNAQDRKKNDSTIGRYGVEPRSSQELADPVEILVKVHEFVPGSKIGAAPRWEGGHHGDSGVNAIGFVRASVERVGDQRGLHVFEAQSDWGGIDKVREGAHKGKFRTSDKKIHDSFEDAEQHNAKRHPLLPDYNRVVLKAAIKYAIDNKLDFVAISDPETAMMTERHHESAGMVEAVDPERARILSDHDMVYYHGEDWKGGSYLMVDGQGILRVDIPSANWPEHRVAAAEALVAHGYGNLKPHDQPISRPIPQEKGMRENYGNILPRVLSQLTGSDVVSVEFEGTHGNYSSRYPAFDNKKTITANAADLTAVKTAFASGKAYTLFGADRVERPMVKHPEVRYSAIFPPAFEKFFEDKVWPTLRRNGVTKDPISLIHAITQADIGRIVRSNPLGALLARQLDTLYIKRTGRENRKLNELTALEAEHGKFLDSPEFVAWVHDSLDGKSDSVASLPAEMQDAGRAFRDWIKSFHSEQNKLGIGVLEFERGRLKYRPARDIEGYTPVGVDKAVYDAMEEGGEAWDKYRKDWFDHWKAVKGTLDGAEEALASFKAPFAASRVTGGEPLFGAVRVQAGIGLPKSWRSTSVRDGLSTYIHQWATDLTWGEVMESNPLMRRALGITHDAMGKKTIEADAKARPSPAEWEAIIDTGAKMDAPWLDTLDPDMPLDMIVRGDSAFGQSLYHNYTQRPLQRGALGKLGETANQASAAMMMQHFSKARNILQSASTVLDYALDAETAGPVFSSLIDSIVAPAQAIRSAEAAGSQGMDIMRQETANAMADGVYKTLRGFRKYSGLQAMDAYAKALAYNIAEAAVRAQHSALGTESPLIREFGPVDKTDEEAVIRQTAAAIANRTDPSFDVRSIPSTMIPQNRSFMGNMLRLMTWSVGRFNNWYQDVWRPAVRGERYDRLLKSLIIGTIGAVATQELFALLQDKMPRDLSVREWSKLPEDKQYSEVAPMVFGYLQAQGAMGILGDLAYAGSRVAAGRSPTQDYTRPMIPAFLVMRDTADTIWDFLTYARDERGWDVDGVDIMKLGVELAKSMQTFRAVVNRGDSWLPERLQAEAADAKDRREMRVFEELEKRSARTGEPLSPSTLRGKAAAAFTRDPFSLGKELKFRQGEDLEAILPSLVEAAKGGQEFRLPKEVRTRSYYEDIARRRGATLAEQVLAADLQSENERTRKGALVRGLNRVADNAKR